MNHTPFEYGGKHFIPERQFEPAGEHHRLIRVSRLRLDVELDFCKKGYAYPSKFNYSHKDFYAASTDKEAMVSGDYPELVKLFGERVAEQAEKTYIELNGPKLQGIPNDPITAEGCEVIGHEDDLRGKVIVIKPEVLRQECQRRNEIVRKRRRNFVVFRRAGGVTKLSVSLFKKECSRYQHDQCHQ